MIKQKRRQRCRRYRIRNKILPKKYYTLGDTFCQEERLKRVENRVAEWGGKVRTPTLTKQGWGTRLAEFFLPGFGGLDFPDGLHLFAAIGFLHELVIEGVARLFVFGGPDDGFGGVSEIAAGEIGRRVGLDPGDVVEEFKLSCCMAKPTL
jgi:hypothetical protein